MAQYGTDRSVEPWLRSTRQQTPAVVRAVLHALDLAREDLERWAWPLSPEQLELMPFGLPSVAFQARHIVRSLDRLLTYAEGGQLSEEQVCALGSEHAEGAKERTRAEFESGLANAERRILVLPLAHLDLSRHVGRARLEVTLAGLLIHLADHTQRHAGQAVTTAKVVGALQVAEQS